MATIHVQSSEVGALHELECRALNPDHVSKFNKSARHRYWAGPGQCISDFFDRSLDRGPSQPAAPGKYSSHRKQADASVLSGSLRLGTRRGPFSDWTAVCLKPLRPKFATTFGFCSTVSSRLTRCGLGQSTVRLHDATLPTSRRCTRTRSRIGFLLVRTPSDCDGQSSRKR